MKLAYTVIAFTYARFLAIQMCGCRRARVIVDCLLHYCVVVLQHYAFVFIYRFIFLFLLLLCSTWLVDILTPALSLVLHYASFVTLSTATKYPVNTAQRQLVLTASNEHLPGQSHPCVGGNRLFPHAFEMLFSVIPFLFGIKVHFIPRCKCNAFV